MYKKQITADTPFRGWLLLTASVGGGGTILCGCAATGEIAEHFNGSCSRNLRLPTLGIGWQIPVVALLPASVPFYMAVFLACVKPSHPFCVRGVVRCAGRGRSGDEGLAAPPRAPSPASEAPWLSVRPLPHLPAVSPQPAAYHGRRCGQPRGDWLAPAPIMHTAADSAPRIADCSDGKHNGTNKCARTPTARVPTCRAQASHTERVCSHWGAKTALFWRTHLTIQF